MRLQLQLHLRSDATFGRGEGLAGLVDEEVEYDIATGLPFVRGRTLKGLLVEECANLLFALRGNTTAIAALEPAAHFLFGRPGSGLDDEAQLHVGHGLLPEKLRQAVEAGIANDGLQAADILESLTAIRRQTAVDEQSGAPDEGSLRSMRVVLRETTFAAWLDFAAAPDTDALALLAACALCLRRGGVGRNRGRGRLAARLCDEQDSDVTMSHYERFSEIVAGKVAVGGQL